MIATKFSPMMTSRGLWLRSVVLVLFAVAFPSCCPIDRQFSSVEIATRFGMAAHLLRQNLLLPSPTPQMTLHDARTQLRRMPPAYSTAQTPFSRDKDFAPQLRYQLESTVRKPAKLRPCKVIFVGDCAVGKTAIVNRWVGAVKLLES